MQNTPTSERVHIAFFGRRNAGKSSLINAVTNQALSVVSDVAGTTTDPVYKSMELLPLGPVTLIDTAGIDDTGALGALRVRKTQQVLNKTDLAVLVVDASEGMKEDDRDLVRRFEERKLNYLIVYNKCDLVEAPPPAGSHEIYVSAETGVHIEALKEKMAHMTVTDEPKRRIVADLLKPNDLVVLVTPIDSAAPKGRLILPQQQTIRDVLEADAAAVVVKEYELAETLKALAKKPRLVITDSQAFAKVSADTPPDIPLTSFSILFARYKGDLELTVRGVRALDGIQDGDRILISEGCTHHRQCEDIGTVKLPGWIRAYTGAQPEFAFTSGTEFPEDLAPYKLIVHCGGCMLNSREMQHRQRSAAAAGIPITNYGITIAHMQGILRRSLEPFADFAGLL